MPLGGRRLLMAGSGGGLSLPPYNDEFNDPGTFSTQWGETAGDPTTIASDIDTTRPGELYLQGQRYQVAPSPPFTVTSEIVYVDWDTGPDVGGIWINIAAAAPGPYFGAGVDVGTPGTMWLSGSVFNSSGAFVTNVNIHDSVVGYGYAVPQRQRMTVNSATDIDWDVSFDDGETWTNVITAYNPGFALNYIGLESGGCRTGFDWFRVTFP
jgi:hypothetical protein